MFRNSSFFGKNWLFLRFYNLFLFYTPASISLSRKCLTESYAAGCLLNHTSRNFSNYVQHERVIMQIRYAFIHQDPVAWSPISPNLWLHFNPGFFIPSFKSILGIIFYIAFRASSHLILDRKNSIEFFIKAFRSEISFKLTIGYLNPALNNLAQ